MAEIKKIEIVIGDKSVELTPREAKELRDALNEMYQPAKEVIKEVHRYDRRWNDGWRWPWDTTTTWTTASDSTRVSYDKDSATVLFSVL